MLDFLHADEYRDRRIADGDNHRDPRLGHAAGGELGPAEVFGLGDRGAGLEREYLWLGALDGLESATCFSMVTLTILGHDELVLNEQRRLLASFDAANGIIMFSWATAIVLATVQRIYFNK